MHFTLFSEFMEMSAKEWVMFGICALLVALAVIMLTVNKGKKLESQSERTRAMVVGALCIAMSFVLSYVRIVAMPQGGSVTAASMLPIMAYAYFYGPRRGLLAGLCYSLLQFIQDAWVLNIWQFLLDYPLAFMALGVTAFFRKKGGLLLGMTVSGVLRFLCHFLSGWIFFAQDYAPAGMNYALYSFLYQLTSVGIDLVICVVIAYFMEKQHVFERVFRDKALVAQPAH